MQEKLSLVARFFVKHAETIAALFIILGIIIFCIVYQPKKVQPVLDLVGLKRVDDNTPIDIDKAITLFSKEANKKILKGSHIIVRKIDIKTPNNAIKKYIHWKIMQNFTERGDIDVYDNYNIIMQDIKNDGEIFIVNASLEKFGGISSDKLFDYQENYDYRFFISMDRNGRETGTDVSVLMRNYAIKDENLERLEFPYESLNNETYSGQIEKNDVSSKDTRPSDSRYIIDAKGVGAFVLNGKIPTVAEGYQIKKELREDEGSEYPMYVVFEKGVEVLEFVPGFNDSKWQWLNTIHDIRVFSDQYHTDKGIKVGSSIEELVKAYPAESIFYTYISDWFVYAIDISDFIKIQFQLDGENFIGKQDLMSSDIVELSLKDFKLGTKVIGIRIYANSGD
jgi:hypothetical protein